MNKIIGSLSYDDYNVLINNNIIFAENINKNQIQPSSIDLTLSNECYEIEASFLSSKKTVREHLEEIIIRKIDISKKFLFKKNKTFLVKLNENLNLPKNIFGKIRMKWVTWLCQA